MTMSSVADKASATSWRTRGAAGWLGLAASPTFALMAWLAVNDAPTLCSPGPGILPIDGMTAMYLLMTVFHLAPWLKLVSGQPWART